jgi:XTP/dITP diphosphohydrolase
MRELRFLSGNEEKIREVREILGPAGITVVPFPKDIHELQTEDAKLLVRDKVLKAFDAVGRPVFVEHTGLYLDALNGLPGGLTRIFWDRLQKDNFARLVQGLCNNKVVARTMIGYCDSKRVHFFVGEVSGTIPPVPAGPSNFQWDCVFVPEGYRQTFAELGERKNDISMRRLALNELVRFLAKEQ